MKRRTVLAAALLARPALAAPPRRLAVIDWGLVELVLSLGITPVAAGELQSYRTWVNDPPMPAGVLDFGLRGDPNMELLWRAAPDLILTTPQFASFQPRFERLAPVASFATYVPGGNPLDLCFANAAALGRLLGREAEAAALRDRAAAELDAQARRLAPIGDRPLLMANFIDARHLRVHGGNSLFGTTIARLGLRNAWTEPTNFWGFGTVTLERLADPAARLVIAGPVSPAVMEGLVRNPVWQALPAVRVGRVAILPPCWAFGSLPTALRFARMLPDV